MRKLNLGSLSQYGKELTEKPYKGLSILGGLAGLAAGVALGPAGLLVTMALGAGYGAAMGTGIYATNRLYKKTVPYAERLKSTLGYA